MKIVMVVPRFPKTSETFIVSKFTGLLERGHDVHVVCQRSESSDWEWYPQLRSRPDLRRRVHVAWPVRPRWIVPLLFPLVLVRSLLANPRATFRYVGLGRMPGSWGRALRRLYEDAGILAVAPDLAHFEFAALAVERMHVAENLGCRVVVSLRGYDINYFGLDDPNCYGEVWSKAAGIHCLGEDLWATAQRRGCPAERPHALIPPAIDVESFTKLAPGTDDDEAAGTPDRPLRIFGMGRMHWTKGYDDALMAVRRLIDRGVACEYRIAGDGDRLDQVAFARRQLNLDDQIQLLGAVPRAEIIEQAAWADVLLHAAVSEGFCNAVVEAQAMGLPVVCTDAGGLPENVADGHTGFIVPRRDPDALAEKLALLARDPALRRRMGKAGRARASERFDLRRQIDAFEAFYHEVLGDQASRRGGGVESGKRGAIAAECSA